MHTLFFPLNGYESLTTEGATAWTSIPALFAIDQTTAIRTVNGQTDFQYMTDRDGLRSMVSMGAQTAEAISDALDVIGKLYAHCDHAEISPEDQATIGWLICGLGELSRQVTAATHGASLALTDGRHMATSTEPG